MTRFPSRVAFTWRASVVVLTLGLPPAAAGQTDHATLDPRFGEPALELSSVSALRVAPDHSILLAERNPAALYRVALDGRRVDTLMRAGGGPGEIRSIWALGWLADTLVVIDGAGVRINYLTAAGRLLGTEAMLDRCPDLTTTLMADRRCMVFPLPKTSGDPDREVRSLIVAGAGWRGADTVARYRIEHSVLRFRFRDAALSMFQPFDDTPLVSAAPDGTFLVMLDREAPAAARARFTIRRWTVDRRWTATRQYPYTARALTGSDADTALTRLVSPNPPLPKDVPPIPRSAFADRMYRPAYFPPVQQLMVGRDHSTWMLLVDQASGQMTDSLVTWVVLDEKLQERRRVTVPRGRQLKDADGDLLWALRLDEDGVPHVERYRIAAGS